MWGGVRVWGGVGWGCGVWVNVVGLCGGVWVRGVQYVAHSFLPTGEVLVFAQGINRRL